MKQLELCYVPPGPFWMGSGETDRSASTAERPQHVRVIEQGYWVSRTAITVSQYRSVGYDSYQRRSSRPIVEVDWRDAMAFCATLTQQWHAANVLPEDWQVRLPTEAEWEKAARGGVQIPAKPIICEVAQAIKQNSEYDHVELIDNPQPMRRYPWGDQPSAKQRKIHADDGPAFATLFSSGISPYGCEDMAGNIWEWCLNKMTPDYEAYYEDLDPTGDEPRIVRGGAFDRLQRFARCSFRYWHDPRFKFEMMGFRVVMAMAT